MTVREGATADRETIRGFYEAYFVELWKRPWQPEPPDDAWLEGKLLLIAEEGGEPVGGLVASVVPGTTAHVHLVYVAPERRRSGVARALLRQLAERLRAAGAVHVTLNTDLSNSGALAVWRRLGFQDVAVTMTAQLDALAAGLAEREESGPAYASIHVQTDDVTAVERAVRKHVPRIGRSSGSAVSRPHNGWVAVYDELIDRDHTALRRLARELSNATVSVVVALAVEGRVVRYLLLERGNVVDEYLSVPEYNGPLPPGDVVALGANPTAVARLTGADPARVRQVARTARTPDELPPAPELAASIAEVLGLASADSGYGEALTRPGVTPIVHG